MAAPGCRARLMLFGAPRLELDSGMEGIKRRKSLGLLAYLATTGRTVSREKSAAMFWTDLEPASARSNLRKALLDISRVCDGALCAVTRDSVGPVNDESLWVDIHEFERLLAKYRRAGRQQGEGAAPSKPRDDMPNALLEQAVSLYDADFLSGFELPGCDEFDEWRFFHAEYLRQELCTVLEQLVVLSEQEGDLERGIAYGRRLVAVAPLDEAAHRALMRMLASAGRRSAAERQFEVCSHVLRNDLGLRPEGETVRLLETIRGGEIGKSPLQSGAGSGTGERARHARPGLPRIAVLAPASAGLAAGQFASVLKEAVLSQLNDENVAVVIDQSGEAWAADEHVSPMRIATELRADFLLFLAAPTTSGVKTKVTVELYAAENGQNCWTTEFAAGRADDPESTIPAARRIVAEIAAQLRRPLSGAGSARRTRAPTPEAMQLCALGNFHLKDSLYEGTGVETARVHFGQAIQEDNGCAEASASLAYSYFAQGGNGVDVRFHDRLTVNIESLVERALDLDPGGATALMVRAGKLLEWDWDFAAAEAAFQHALSLHPHHVDTLVWYGQLLSDVGRLEEAGRVFLSALEQNPLDLTAMYRLARYFEYTGSYRKAGDVLARLKSRYPDRNHARALEPCLLIDMGRFDEAITVARGYAERYPSNLTVFFVGAAHAAAGHEAEARKALQWILENRRSGEDPYLIAQAYHVVHDDRAALEWMDTAIRDLDVDCILTATDYRWGNLHFTTEFQERVRRIGLPLCTEYIESALAQIAPNQAW